MNSKTERHKRIDSKSYLFDNLKTTKKKSIKFIYIFMMMSFMVFLIVTIFYTNYIIMSYLYKNVNQFYLTQYVIQPISNLNENFTQTMTLRIKTIEQIILESKLMNIGAMTEFVMKNEIKSLPSYKIESSIDENNYNADLNGEGLRKIPDMFINITSKEGSPQENTYNKFLILSEFLSFINKNSDVPFIIEEMMILDLKRMEYLTYTKNFKRPKQFIQSDFTTSYIWEEIQKKFVDHKFLDYIVENIYSQDSNYFNYVKLFRQNFTIDGEEHVYYIFFRLNYIEIKKIFDKIGNNMTILFQYESILQKRMNLNYLPISNYMSLFFRYGIRYYINPNESLADYLLSRTVEQLENYKLTDLSVYFNTLNNYDFWNKSFNKDQIRYNLNFYNEFRIISGLFYKILKIYFDYKDIRQVLGNSNPYFENYVYDKSNILNYTECVKSINDTYSEMMCDIIKFDETFTLHDLSLPGMNSNDNMNSPDEYSKTLDLLLKSNFGQPLYLQESNIFTSSKGRSFNKKFIIYMSRINNLQVVSLNMVNMEDYYDLEEKFTGNISFYSKVTMFLLMFFCIAVFFVSLIITNRSANSMLKRLVWLKDLKSSILYKDSGVASVLCDNFQGNYAAISRLVKRTLEKKIQEKEKIEMLEKDKFIEMLTILIIESKVRLRKLLEKIDCGK
jgi:hypothetical protein